MDKANFFKDVYDVVRQIPAGRVTSYGAIAQYLGVKSGARMVGWAMNASFTEKEYVPAHRVVNRKGLLTGKHHFSNPNAMEDRLKAEGIEVENDQITQFEKYYWDPSKELEI